MVEVGGSCPICCEDFDRFLKRKAVTHQCDAHTQFTACESCIKHYLFNPESDIEPQCMNCNKRWNRKFLLSFLSKSYINSVVKKQREKIFFIREQSYLTATIPYINQKKRENERKESMKVNNERLKELSLTKREITASIEQLKKEKNGRKKVPQIDERIKQLKEQIYDINVNIRSLHDKIYAGDEKANEVDEKEVDEKVNEVDEKETEIEFVRKCPSEGCSGFLLKKIWKCSTCEKRYCAKCFVERLHGEQHECKKEDLELIQLLKTDTKPCPCCFEMITKTYGCDQMWCTKCHTGFSWTSGKIVTGKIHNPHYFEFLQENRNIERNIDDIDCGGIPDIRYEIYVRMSTDEQMIVSAIHRLLNELQQYHLPRYDVQNLNPFEINLGHRIRWMENEINEKHFKMLLHKKIKQIEKEEEISNILNMFITIGSDILRNCIHATPGGRQIAEEYSNFLHLIDYFNQNMRENSILFDSSIYIHIEENIIGNDIIHLIINDRKKTK